MEAFSPQLITAIFAGLSLLLTGVLGFSYKIWRDHNKMIREMNDRMLQVLTKNSVVNEKLSNAMYKLSDTSKENTTATKQSTDMLSKLMLELIRTK